MIGKREQKMELVSIAAIKPVIDTKEENDGKEPTEMRK